MVMNKTFEFTPATSAAHVLIVGGGASGVLLAAQLLRQVPETLVTIVERRAEIGPGLAYSTPEPWHLLNTRAGNMSAWPDQPEHFSDWLRENAPDAAARCFVSRNHYARYLAELVAPSRLSGHLRCVFGECRRVEEGAQGVRAELSDGRMIRADIAVLATGHPAVGNELDGMSNPWAQKPLTGTERILIVGSGQTMTDQLLSLGAAGHMGKIIILSRRSQLPRVHTDNRPLQIFLDEVPRGAGAAEAMRWLRRRVHGHMQQGGDWRDVVDGLRPHVQRIWAAMPLSARGAFLRHACRWWEVHRHRMPPEGEAALDKLNAEGRITRMRGAFLSTTREGDGSIKALVSQDGAVTELQVDRVLDCRGIRRDPARHGAPVLADLLQRGRARIDPLGLGPEVTAHCALINVDGTPSTRIFAIGPVTRAAFWEITAIPDIREQAVRLASHLVAWRLKAHKPMASGVA